MNYCYTTTNPVSASTNNQVNDPTNNPVTESGPDSSSCVNSYSDFTYDGGSINCDDVAAVKPKGLVKACNDHTVKKECPSICNRNSCKCVNYTGRINNAAIRRNL